MEAKLARGASAVLTVNDLLADELARRYGIPRPIAVRNVPPLVALRTRADADGPAGSTAGSVRSDDNPTGSAAGGARRDGNPTGSTASSARPDGSLTGLTAGSGRPDDGTLRLLLHGSWVGLEQPGVDAALRAVARLPAARLTLRGGVRNPEALRVRLAELGISERVALRPRLPGADALVRAAIAEQHDVGLSVHLPDCLSRRLATSSKVFEYLMAGLVVVAAEQEGNRHILDERCARFFHPGDDEALARVLTGLAADRRALVALQRAARARAESEFCWEREQGRLLDLYAEPRR